MDRQIIILSRITVCLLLLAIQSLVNTSLSAQWLRTSSEVVRWCNDLFLPRYFLIIRLYHSYTPLGARAAQVVPHVHFHIIPRPETMPQIKSKSWTMFGRGQRDDLDDEEGASLAAEMRRVLREELEKMESAPKL